MSATILNQPWEDVADDVTGAIEKAVQPLLKKAVDDIYCGLLDATQGYLRDNVAFNIASRIDCAERQALSDRQDLARERKKTAALLAALEEALDLMHGNNDMSLQGSDEWLWANSARAAVALAKGEAK